MPPPPKEDLDPPYTLADFDSADPQARLEQLCGPCLSSHETAEIMGVAERTVLNRYHRDELISFRAATGDKNHRRFPKWQFKVSGGPNPARPWVQPIIAAFGQNGWGLVEFLTKPHQLGQSYLVRLHHGGDAVKQVIAAAKRINTKRIRSKADGQSGI